MPTSNGMLPVHLQDMLCSGDHTHRHVSALLPIMFKTVVCSHHFMLMLTCMCAAPQPTCSTPAGKHAHMAVSQLCCPSAMLMWRCVCMRAVYVFVSYRLFQLTGTLKTAVVPAKAGRELLRNCALIALTGAVLWLASVFLIRVGGLKRAGAPFMDTPGSGDYVEVIPQG